MTVSSVGTPTWEYVCDWCGTKLVASVTRPDGWRSFPKSLFEPTLVGHEGHWCPDCVKTIVAPKKGASVEPKNGSSLVVLPTFRRSIDLLVSRFQNQREKMLFRMSNANDKIVKLNDELQMETREVTAAQEGFEPIIKEMESLREEIHADLRKQLIANKSATVQDSALVLAWAEPIKPMSFDDEPHIEEYVDDVECYRCPLSEFPLTSEK